MNVKKVPPRWQRLGFASEEDMNRHGAIYKRRKAQIDYLAKSIEEARWFDDGYYQAKKEKENENGRD
ncbi:hypothetical protein EFR21_01560 [Lactobacillus delbrueckii subsp. bulgaricus]|uniref:hypothetical protein n=1 Tax=Lactobacillus delbrueckii TaxID=1584 RepID=UPI0021A9300D|nr:hypothetical protein [Lactobacillus delbrueckii]MCT3465892.1 hypothetical protein [Lactobacillus delbrueckii subsp. bulgaricus]MCT3470827.1 hypothetical protein [Lactobacillus delbrueckii subsp. bulgaricus]